MISLKIQTIWENTRQTYGYPRVYAELRAEGWHISRKRVARLMQELALKVKKPKPFKPKTTVSDPKHAIATNHLARDFEAQKPNQKWLVDITYVATKEGWLYVAGVLDLYSRKIVGLAMNSKRFKSSSGMKKMSSGYMRKS